MDNTTLIVVGAYTLVYVIVFIIQHNQLKSQKSVIDSMKTFIDIFKVEEVRRFVDMRDERIRGEVEHIIKNDKRIDEKIEEWTSGVLVDIEDNYKEVFKKIFFQMAVVILEYMTFVPMNEREDFIKENLSHSQDMFIKMLNEIKDVDFSSEDSIPGS